MLAIKNYTTNFFTLFIFHSKRNVPPYRRTAVPFAKSLYHIKKEGYNILYNIYIIIYILYKYSYKQSNTKNIKY